VKAKRILIGIIGGIALLMIVIAYQITNGYKYKLIPYWYVNKYIDNAHKQDMIIQKSQTVKINQSKYKIVFSTHKNKDSALNLNCFKVVLGGAMSIDTLSQQGTEGESRFSIAQHYFNTNNTIDYFVIVYGFNENYQASSYSIEIENDKRYITQNIENEKYFMHTYDKVNFTNIQFYDISNDSLNWTDAVK
jgi:hypothetical protein